MGNTTNKNKLEETFDTWDIPIIVKNINCQESFYKNKKAIQDTIDDKLLVLLTNLNIGCDTYKVYTNKMLFELCKSNAFILKYDIESMEIKYHYISEYLCSYLKLYPIKSSESLLTLKSFFNLFSKSSLHNFNLQVTDTIQLFNNNFLWNGLLYLSEKYNLFQINAEIEYSNNFAIFYCNISDIQHVIDKNIKSIHKTENVDFVPTNIELFSENNNILAINIKSCIKKWLDKQKIENYFISPDVPTYIVLNKEKMFTVINYFYRNIELFELHCNHYFLILRFQTKDISSMTHFCQNIINYIHKMKGTIYYTDNIVEIRIPYKKDNYNRPEKEIITKKKVILENMTIYLIDHNEINRENTKNYLKTKYICVIDGKTIKDIDLLNHRPNSILIYNSETEKHKVDILRERGIIMPVVISDCLKKSENYYNYSLSYPFNNDEIYQVLIDIKTKINIVYLDKTVKNSILVKNMLDRLDSYNIYIESRLEKLESIINSLDIQLIILDSSILSYYLSDYPSRIFKSLGVSIPILFIQNNKQCLFDYYTEKINKPFNLETLNEKIINCFS
jgi:hypothetical protein